MNIRKLGYCYSENEIKHGIFIKTEGNEKEKLVFMKDGIEIEFNLDIVRSVIENYEKSKVSRGSD